VLSSGDLAERVCEIEDPRSEYFRHIDAAAGMIAKRALAPGEMLTSNCVEAASLVHNGDTVRLVALSNGIQVSTLARALQNGKLGDRIKVRNIVSNRAITAVVTGLGEVRVAQ
jgi:flagella basal body P-ring formation protein FlgA